MKRSTDLFLTICFLLYYAYYDCLGFVFGGMSRGNYNPYIFLALLGLVLIMVSLLFKKILPFSLVRIVGIILAVSLLYFDVKGSLIYETNWKTFKAIVTYFPSLVVFVFTILSFVRIKALNQQKRIQ